MRKEQLLITCEHASNRLPDIDILIDIPKNVLQTHEGYDIGAHSYALSIASLMDVSCMAAPFSRLVVDPNRSLHNQKKCFSRYTASLTELEKNRLIALCYSPFRHNVMSLLVQKVLEEKTVYHLSCHSFTDFFLGNQREYDVAFLYDPKRALEVAFAEALRVRLKKHLRVVCNRPYKGISDGHTSALRTFFGEDFYVGIEIEVNQRFFASDIKSVPFLCEEVAFVCSHFQ